MKVKVKVRGLLHLRVALFCCEGKSERCIDVKKLTETQIRDIFVTAAAKFFPERTEFSASLQRAAD